MADIDDDIQEIIDALEIAIASRASEYAQLSSDLAVMKGKKANSMAKSREEYASEGRLIVFQRMAAMRAREKKTKQVPSAPAPTATVNTARQFGTEVTNPTALAEQIVRAGQKARGELVEETPGPTGLAAKVLAAAQTSRDGGPQRPAPEGLAAQIVAAGIKRRTPRGE